MARRTDPAALGPFVGVVGSLTLLGGAAASWIEQPVARSVGDVAVAGTRATPGLEIAPLTVVAALAGLLGSVGVLVTRGTARRTMSLLLVVTGVAAVAIVGIGIVTLPTTDGVRTVAPWIAAVGAAGILAAGLGGVGRPPGRRMPARYDVDVTPQDAEWRLASADDEVGPTASYASPPGDPDLIDGEVEQR
jgi:hypothetical protein